jgi:hypothetical protein
LVVIEPIVPLGASGTHVLIPDILPYENTAFHTPVLSLCVYDVPLIVGSKTTVTTLSLAHTDTANTGAEIIIIIANNTYFIKHHLCLDY